MRSFAVLTYTSSISNIHVPRTYSWKFQFMCYGYNDLGLMSSKFKMLWLYCFYFLKAWWSAWEIGRFKLFLHRGINIVHEFSCTRNAVCVHVTRTVVTMHAICEGMKHKSLLQGDAIILDVSNKGYPKYPK